MSNGRGPNAAAWPPLPPPLLHTGTLTLATHSAMALKDWTEQDKRVA